MLSVVPDLPATAYRDELGHSTAQLAVRRGLDVVASLMLLIVVAIPALAIAAIVKATSPGPVFFTQTRVGKHGELFSVIKFRSMRNGTHAEVLADEALVAAYRDNDFKLSADDPRITTIGRIIRKTSLDEIPQLFNVLKGEMSMVGIRPLLPEEVSLRTRYDQELYRSLRPGMTGLWQVEGRSTVAKDDRLQLDRTYVEDWSMWNDLKILARTPFAVLRIGHAH